MEYAWSVSAMLMNGETAAILLFCALIILVILYTAVLKTIVKRLNRRMPKDHYRSNSISSTAESVKSVISENSMETYLVYGGIPALLSDDLANNSRKSSLHEEASDDTPKSPELELTYTNQTKKKTTISIVENPLF
eukprot:gene5458-5858_t